MTLTVLLDEDNHGKCAEWLLLSPSEPDYNELTYAPKERSHMSDTLSTLFDAVIRGDKATVEGEVQKALDSGEVPQAILNQGLIAAMTEVGDRFERQEFFVPEMLIAARAMQSGLQLLKPHLVDGDINAAGKVVAGTVRGDMHDIGKNLVVMMLEGAGFEINDLGTDVAPEAFVKAVQAEQPDIVAMSALLTTTMPNMRATIVALEEAGIRDRVKIVVGGAPLTSEYATEIGADGYAADASRAVKLAKELMGVT
jgi:5-methyltetrahydrofolate--homocysteine methyltransferase